MSGGEAPETNQAPEIDRHMLRRFYKIFERAGQGLSRRFGLLWDSTVVETLVGNFERRGDAMRLKIMALVAGLAGGMVAMPTAAEAFCGFYVSGADKQLYNNATQVVLMREGTRTVLSMQNNYQGPASDFAMVVPVPTVLQEENVRTLPREIFSRVDSLAAPRLVEYWEQDPCRQPELAKAGRGMRMPASARPVESESSSGDMGVTVEAQFTVGEYEIVILSALDSTGLDKWLRQEKYKIPEGAEAFLRPYVQSGSKFFVARVNAEKVQFKDGMATLSPLRFFYDSENFNLPVRLGLMNAKGKQDLIVHILAPGKRYEVANYENVTIPTNLDVIDDARNRFGEFYAALFDRTLEKNANAVVTEYSWDSASCDPCPTPPLSQAELMTLGADVLDVPMPKVKPRPTKKAAIKPSKKKDAVSELLAPGKTKRAMPRRPPPRPVRYRQFVLTRLHARYDAASMKDDLIFKSADGIVGGREHRSGADRTLEKGASKSSINNFQARYAIRHEWTGPIECQTPVRGRWGGPPPGVKRDSKPKPALNLAFAPRGKQKLAQMTRSEIPELDVVAAPAAGAGAKETPVKTADPTKPGTDKPAAKESKGCAVGGVGGLGALLLGLALIALVSRLSRRSRAKTKRG